MHVLPGLSLLEKRYESQPFTVVGVHSAKFDNEKVVPQAQVPANPSVHALCGYAMFTAVQIRTDF